MGSRGRWVGELGVFSWGESTPSSAMRVWGIAVKQWLLEFVVHRGTAAEGATVTGRIQFSNNGKWAKILPHSRTKHV